MGEIEKIQIPVSHNRIVSKLFVSGLRTQVLKPINRPHSGSWSYGSRRSSGRRKEVSTGLDFRTEPFGFRDNAVDFAFPFRLRERYLKNASIGSVGNEVEFLIGQRTERRAFVLQIDEFLKRGFGDDVVVGSGEIRRSFACQFPNQSSFRKDSVSLGSVPDFLELGNEFFNGRKPLFVQFLSVSASLS